jgi:hypothetical protein
MLIVVMILVWLSGCDLAAGTDIVSMLGMVIPATNDLSNWK